MLTGYVLREIQIFFLRSKLLGSEGASNVELLLHPICFPHREHMHRSCARDALMPNKELTKADRFPTTA
jgi:hypothetical protein